MNIANAVFAVFHEQDAAPAARGGTMVIRRWVTFAGIVLIVLIIGADSYEGWQDYREVVTDNENAELGLSRALAEQTARMVQEADVLLSSESEWMVTPAGMAADPEEISARLRSDFGRLPFIRSAVVAGADGHVLARTHGEGSGATSIGDRAAFTSPRDAADDLLYVGRPYVATRDGSVNFALSRRIVDAHGRFAGVVAASIAFDYLAGFYAGVDITPDTHIKVARQDGVVLAQYPLDSDSAVNDRYVQQSYGAAGRLIERVHREKGADGVDRFIALHTVEGYPLAVDVSRPVKSVLQPWVWRELESAARTLTLALLAAVLIVALRTALRRRDRLEVELHNARHAEALGFLAASVAHDFNNVLSAIVGYAELARNTTQEGSATRTNVDRLLSAAERARLLVRRVLTFNPRRNVGYKSVALQPVVVEVVQQLQATLPRPVVVKLVGAELEPTVQGDPTELHQVVMNLCTNAVHAMPDGGVLEIRTGIRDVVATEVVNVGRLTVGRWVTLSVTDTGIGLAADKLGSIFEPFYSTRAPGTGSGIGLAVVRNIVTRMNGAISVSSVPGKGTCVLVFWPLLAHEAPPRFAALPDRGFHAHGQTIMIVDDEAELVSLAEELLASAGYEPVGFIDARTALEAVRSDPYRFDAIITDERMPVMRGVEFAKLVHVASPGLPIIMMTGHRDPGLDCHAGDAGIAVILEKPLRAETLLAALEAQLRSTAVASETAAVDAAVTHQ